MSGEGGIWVLADPRAGTAAQALGIAERLDRPFRAVPLEWGPLARLPLPWPGLLGLTARAREGLRRAALEGPWSRVPPGTTPRIVPEWPSLVIAAGRRSAPVSRWLRRQGARTVHCMRPGAAAADFDLLVIGRHDHPAPAPNILPILGATHRISPAALAAARESRPDLAALPRPRVAVLLGGAVRGEGMDPAEAAAIIGRVVPGAGSVLATTSRRTGAAAAEAVAARLSGVPGLLHRWGQEGPNPYAAFLALADAVVVTGDSVSMLSEALATSAPVFVAGTPPDAPRHMALRESLFAAGQAAPFAAFPNAPPRAPLDESGRVAAVIRDRFLAG
ncbi:mitochondrial fission ELM1 family protein [Roseomonas populi]|uniref:Mitochondrial fission ELM1 family protein n=1 Tax=Roseomonas populi TaxID=3121582 RepID=A0ABT1WYB7_9PROT|nr:mitochondrial fission ELM1 family protein [Roseomonas pecuniae]MCR0980835.1 mitochondrial fission ELM1 family protein [Roseomonas pecuniae]